MIKLIEVLIELIYTSLYLLKVIFHLISCVVNVPSQNVQDSDDMGSSRDVMQPIRCRQGVLPSGYCVSFHSSTQCKLPAPSLLYWV